VDELLSVKLASVAVNPTNGDVWTSTPSGEVTVRHANNSWDTYTHDEAGMLSLADIVIAPDGKVWLAGQTKHYRPGLSVFDGATWQVLNIPYDAGFWVTDIAFGAGDDVWVGTELGPEQGLFLYETASNTWTPTATCDVAHPRVSALAYNPLNGDLWLGINLENRPNLLRLRQGLPCEAFDNFNMAKLSGLQPKTMAPTAGAPPANPLPVGRTISLNWAD
jgi:hypothetical protein